MSNHDFNITNQCFMSVSSSHHIHQKNKSILDSPYGNTLLDSGYNSTHYLSDNPSNVLHHSNPSNGHCSKDVLDRIDEIGEYSTILSPQVTPTTLSIRKMSALQLQSPLNKQESSQFMRSPLKRSALQPLDIENNPQCTPKKLKYTNENENNILSLSSNKNRIPFSPISSGKATSSININQNKEKKFVKQKSLSTSTPKNLLAQYSIETIENYLPDAPKSASPRKRKRLLKKFQSFSPVSYVKRQSNEKNAEQIKKKLKFTHEKLNNDKLVDSLSPDLSDKNKINALDSIEEEFNSSSIIDQPRKNVTCEDSFDISALIEPSPKKFCDLFYAPIKNTGCEEKNNYDNLKLSKKRQSTSIIIEESPSKKSLLTPSPTSLCDLYVKEKPNEDISIPSIKKYFLDLEQRSLSEQSDVFTSRESCDIRFNKNSLSTTPRDSLELISEIADDTSLTENSISSFNYTNSERFTPLTPRKKSYLSSPEHEKNKILHPELPKTPPKKPKLKSFSSPKVFSGKKESPRPSYEGYKRVNILSHLENVQPALNIIFNYLTDEDLFNVAQVSKNWRRIIKNNLAVNARRKNYMRKTCLVKENLKRKKSKVERLFTTERIPFTQNIVLKKKVLRSPPRSPSKFNENQRFIKRLSKDATVTKCPACNYFCEIKTPSTYVPDILSNNDRKSSSKSPRKKLFQTTHDYSLRQNRRAMSLTATYNKSDEEFNRFKLEKRANSLCYPMTRQRKHDMSLRNKSMNLFDIRQKILPNCEGDSSDSEPSSPIKENRAKCTKCTFEFCIKCRGPYHSNNICKEIGSISPINDDENVNRSRTGGLKKGRSNLKRLCI